ncbi:hypothetical protein V6O07_23250 [Arthrospira platensis SPKY2]
MEALYTPTPTNIRDNSERVPTTRWVQRLLNDYPSHPRVGQDTLLSINVSRGKIRKGNCDNPTDHYFFTEGASKVGLVANATEYVWLRYSDSHIIVTERMPERSIAHLIGIVVTNSERIVSITNYDGWDCNPTVLCDCVDTAGGTWGQENIINSIITISNETPIVTLGRKPGELWIERKSSHTNIWLFESGNWFRIGGTIIQDYTSPIGITAQEGQLYFNKTTQRLFIYNEGNWIRIAQEIT